MTRGTYIYIGTLTIVYSMLTVLMPSGLASITWVAVSLFVYGCGMLAILLFESSRIKNTVFAFTSWLPMIVIHLLEPGTETVAEGAIMETIWIILSVASVHAIFQGGLRLIISKLTLPNKMLR